MDLAPLVLSLQIATAATLLAAISGVGVAALLTKKIFRRVIYSTR